MTLTLTIAEWQDILTALQVAQAPPGPPSDIEESWDRLATHLEQQLDVWS